VTPDRSPAYQDFLRGRARPATATLVTYIDEHRHLFGVEPICRVLTEHGWPIASSTYRAVKAGLPSARQRRDERLVKEIRRVHRSNYHAFGARKVWLTLNREGTPVARCTVERLMRQHGLRARCAAGPFGPPLPMSSRSVRPIWSSASSSPTRRTGCGWPTSPNGRAEGPHGNRGDDWQGPLRFHRPRPGGGCQASR
jgi:helix-turn-helix protein